MDLVLQFYKNFDVLAALPAVIAAMMTAFNEIPDRQKTVFSDLATGLFGSTIILSVIALTLNRMVLFKFQGNGRLTNVELWIPTGLVDFSIVQVLGGLVAWSVDRYPAWVAVLLGSEATILLLGAIALSSKIWADMPGVHGGASTEK